MAQILPFKGLLYNPAEVSGDDVIAPPYDVISPDDREALYLKSPYNIVRVDAGKTLDGDNDADNKYTRAGDLMKKWVEEGVLVRDETPAFYGYEIEYMHSGQRRILRGILALVRIEELGEGIYPHEETHSKPKADRLSLMKACSGNISPIYSLYNSPQKIASSILRDRAQAPVISSTDPDGARHSVFRITGKAEIDSITEEFSDKPVFIADGHHRYEVALAFKKEMESRGSAGAEGGGLPGYRPWDYVMMFLANMSDEGITILPTHRLVRGINGNDIFRKLEPDFSVSKFPKAEVSALTPLLEGRNVFGFYMDREEAWYILKYNGNSLRDLHPAVKDLDVIVLHELILKRDLGVTDIAYEMDASEAMKRVRAGEFDGVFLLNPTGVNDVERVALSGLRMPPKSTYFYPKILTGMVINIFNNNL